MQAHLLVIYGETEQYTPQKLSPLHNEYQSQ